MLDAGVPTGGEKLQDGTGRVLRRAGDRASVTDGPYTESKEVIGGLFQIRADNYEQAFRAASDCPHLLSTDYTDYTASKLTNEIS